MRRWVSYLGVSLFLCTLLVGQQLRPSAIEGTVVDARTGDPIPNLEILTPTTGTVRREPGQRGDPRPRVVTDRDGRFVVENLAGDRVSLRFQQSGYVPRDVTYTLAQGQRVRDVVVRMSPTGVIAGRILGVDGKPVPSVFVAAFRYRISRGLRELVALSPEARTNDLGEFRLYDLPPGRYFIGFASSVYGTGYEHKPDPAAITPVLYPGVPHVSMARMIDVKGGEEVRLSDMALSLVRFGALRIHIVNRAAGSASGTFSLTYLSPSVFGDGTLNSGGEYLPEQSLQLQPGSEIVKTYWPNRPGLFGVQLNWRTSENAFRSVTPIDFNGADVEISIDLLPPERRQLNIQGILLDTDQTRSPLPGVSVGLCLRSAESACVSTELWITRQVAGLRSSSLPVLDAAGRLSLTASPGVYDLYTVAVPQGIYLSTVRQGDRDVLTEGVIVSTEAPSLEFTFRENPATVRGSVRDSQGNPVENALVGLLPERPLDAAKLQSVRRSARTDHNGLFELRGVIPGNYRGYAWAGVSSDVYLDQDFVKAFLTEGSPVEVHERQETFITLRILKSPD